MGTNYEDALLSKIYLKLSSLEAEVKELKSQIGTQHSVGIDDSWLSEYAAVQHPVIRAQGIKTRAKLKQLRESGVISRRCYRQFNQGAITVTEYRVDLTAQEIDAYKSAS